MSARPFDAEQFVRDYAAGKSGAVMAANLELMREAYPPQAFSALMNLLSTHDQPRALHHFGEEQDLALAKRRLRLAVFFQMTYPGSPTIYYGDEVVTRTFGPERIGQKEAPPFFPTMMKNYAMDHAGPSCRLTLTFSRGHAHKAPSYWPNALRRGRRLERVVSPWH